MSEKIISIEKETGPFQDEFKRILKLVPERDKSDRKLQRLIAFRLKIDGESATGNYLVQKISEIRQCGYTGNLYDFLKDDFEEKECGQKNRNSTPPEVA